MQKTQTYKNFLSFYEENKNKLYMPKGVNYPLNYKKGLNWVNNQCDDESRQFANEIINYTEYVSFGAFIKSLNVICSSYINKFNNSNYKNTIFILIIPFNVYKSNTWVSLIVFKHFKDFIYDIYTNITDVYNDTIDSSSRIYNKKVRCIICDDCAYTGSQVTFVASFDYNKINYIEKEAAPDENSKTWLNWHKTSRKHAEKVISKIPPGLFAVDLIIPFMSTLAQASLKKLPWVSIPKDCSIFGTFNQYINVEKFPTYILNEFKKTFQYHKNISSIYFDHKVADSVSTFHKIYLLAPLFNCSIQDASIPFIDGCELKQIPEQINIYDFYVDLGDKIKTCPPTFYKSIKYTYKKKLLKQNKNLLDIIKKF